MSTALTVQPSSVLGNLLTVGGSSAMSGLAAYGWSMWMEGLGSSSFTLGGATMPIPLAHGLIIAASTAVGSLLTTAIQQSNSIRLPPFIQGVEEAVLGPALTGGVFATVTSFESGGDYTAGFTRDFLFGGLANIVGYRLTMMLRRTFPNTFK